MQVVTHPLNLDVEEVPEFTPRTVSVLATRGIRTVRQLAAIRPDDFRGLVELTASEQLAVRRWMEQHGLWLPLHQRMSQELRELSVEKLPLNARTQRTLSWAKIETVGQLVQRSYDELFVLSGMSPNGMQLIKEALRQKDLYLK